MMLFSDFLKDLKLGSLKVSFEEALGVISMKTLFHTALGIDVLNYDSNFCALNFLSDMVQHDIMLFSNSLSTIFILMSSYPTNHLPPHPFVEDSL